MAEKILVRNIDISVKEMESRFWMEYEREFDSPSVFFRSYDFSIFMKDLFNEDVDAIQLEETSLFKSYLEARNTGTENENFKFAYLLKDDLAAYISHHLNLTQVSNILKINEQSLFPWYYAGSKWYICDTWGQTDIEVLTSLHSLSYVDFIKRYRAY